MSMCSEQVKELLWWGGPGEDMPRTFKSRPEAIRQTTSGRAEGGGVPSRGNSICKGSEQQSTWGELIGRCGRSSGNLCFQDGAISRGRPPFLGRAIEYSRGSFSYQIFRKSGWWHGTRTLRKVWLPLWIIYVIWGLPVQPSDLLKVKKKKEYSSLPKRTQGKPKTTTTNLT